MYDKTKYLTAGEVAKKMDITLRTVQYYDNIGLLSPSAYTEGGRRLYSMKDYVLLHQIVSMKELGFSLKEIKEKIMPADSISDIEEYLKVQEEVIKENISRLETDFEIINKFRNEIRRIGKVDWNLFVEILSFLRKKDENYWIIKYFEEDTFSKLKETYKEEKGEKLLNTFNYICDRAGELVEKGTDPEDSEGLQIAKTWWDALFEFTEGDMEIIRQMTKMSREKKENPDNEILKKFSVNETFLNKALNSYLKKNNINFSFEIEEGKND